MAIKLKLLVMWGTPSMGNVLQYFAITNQVHANKGAAKNVVCMFCDKIHHFHSLPEQTAHILKHDLTLMSWAGTQPNAPMCCDQQK